MKIIIVGAGLGGLVCAIACRRQNLDVLVLEKSAAIKEVGAGIQIPPNGTRIMRELGLLDKVIEKGSLVQHVDFRRYKDGRLLRSMPFGDAITEELGAPWIIIHRVDYHQILVDEAMRLGVVMRHDSEVQDVLVDGPEVVLSGGERVAGDVVIGADGLWSKVREVVLGDPVIPEDTGDLAYRATFSREQLESLGDEKVNDLCNKVAVTSWLGPEKHTIFYPVRGGTEFNLVLLHPDNLSRGRRREAADIQEMRESYCDWDETLRKIISCAPSVYKWKLTHLAELPSWTKGRIALLGDACHPTLPYQAQGAAMAVEDGAAIGKLLGLLNARYTEDRGSGNDPTISMRSSHQDDIAALLTLYERMRKARTTRNVRGAVMNRKLFHIPDGILQVIRDFLLARAGVTRKSDWTWFSSFRQRQTLGHDVLGECEPVFKEFYSSRLSERN